MVLNLDLGPLSQLTKATNILLHLQQLLCNGWPPSDREAVFQQFFDFSSGEIDPTVDIHFGGGGVVIAFSLENGEVLGSSGVTSLLSDSKYNKEQNNCLTIQEEHHAAPTFAARINLNV